MNKSSLIGRPTKGIELRQTKSGKSVATFTLAVPGKTKDDPSDFISCVAWNKTAEIFEKYVSKGDLIGIVGRLKTRSYDDKDGKKVYVTEVVVDEVDFLQSKRNESQPAGDDDDYPF